MFLLATNFAKNSDIYARILFIFLKKVLDQTRNSFNANLLIRRGGKQYVRVTLVSM